MIVLKAARILKSAAKRTRRKLQKQGIPPKFLMAVQVHDETLVAICNIAVDKPGLTKLMDDAWQSN